MSSFAEPPDVVGERRTELMLLQGQREALEMEAGAISAELKSPGPNGETPVGIKGPLVDSDGYPLAGFDLFNVREKRHRLNCIQTDHKAVMAKLEKSLHALHEAQAARLQTPSLSSLPSMSASNGVSNTGANGRMTTTSSSTATTAAAGTNSEINNGMPMVPIARVNQVSDGSPAASAGLTVGDLLVRFGEVDISHPKGLGGVVDVVREREGQEVAVTILRHGGMGGQSGLKVLKLVPKTWSGRGLLGVHLLPP